MVFWRALGSLKMLCLVREMEERVRKKKKKKKNVRLTSVSETSNGVGRAGVQTGSFERGGEVDLLARLATVEVEHRLRYVHLGAVDVAGTAIEAEQGQQRRLHLFNDGCFFCLAVTAPGHRS